MKTHLLVSLVPMKGLRTTLAEAGLGSDKLPNTVILTQSDVLRRFLPSNVLSTRELDPGAIACIEAGEGCLGIEFNDARLSHQRTGGFVSVFMNSIWHTETTGWRFYTNALLVNDVGITPAWGGQPLINEVDETNRPLGLLQDIGPSAVMAR